MRASASRGGYHCRLFASLDDALLRTRTEAYRFGDVQRADRRLPFQIGDGASDAQHAVECAGGEMQPLTGGGEYAAGATETGRTPGDFPFAGGSGAGVTVQPVGFLVVGQGNVRMLPVEGGQPVDRLIDLAPQIIDKLRGKKGGGGPTAGAQGTDMNVPRTTIQ
jgi:uncharacterized spore protein YtfJ